MKGSKYIKEKQKIWAKRNAIALCGSKINKGEELYTKILDDNLFMNLSDIHRSEFEAGNGNEMKSSKINMAKMNALHSSSATAVNFFHYWSVSNQLDDIAYGCSLCNKGESITKKLYFEKKFTIVDKSFYTPNIDVVIENHSNFNKKAFAIECKMTEPYSAKRTKKDKELFPSEYLNNKNIWKGISNIFNLANHLSKNIVSFEYLDAGQLIKHILGLKKEYGKSGFRLLYLFYDVLGEESYRHLLELEQFKNVVKEDNIFFSYNTYQEVIIKLNNHYYSENKLYMDYINDRYL